MVVDIGFSIKVVQSNMGTSLQGKKRICEKINKYENVLHPMVDTQSEAPATIYHTITGFYFNVITGLSVFYKCWYKSWFQCWWQCRNEGMKLYKGGGEECLIDGG